MTEPPSSPSYRESHLAKGADYHAVFRENPRRALIWEIEQKLLARIVKRFLNGRPIDHLDFACGTGRILKALEVRTRTSTGIDVSPSMLTVARNNATRAELIQGDLTREDLLPGRRFDLITAFRFFPNAEPELRRNAIAVLSRRLAPGGILVLNNHCNLSGLSRRFVRIVRRGRAGHHGMWDAEIDALVRGAGLAILSRYHVGIVPETETHSLRPRWLISAFEHVATRLPLAAWSDDVLYVCGQRDAGTGSGG